jgi:YD repeat-containing protein
VVERRTGAAVTRFGYDTAGRIVTATDADSVIRLERDVLGRVISETVNEYTVTTSYNAEFGSVTWRTRPSGVVTQWSYDESGRPQILVAGGQQIAVDPGPRPGPVPTEATIDQHDAPYTFDAHGRPVTRSDAAGDWHLTWDHHDRLIAVTTPGGERWHYRYDTFGRRIAKQCRGPKGAVLEEVQFVWSGDLLVEQHHRGRGGRVTATAWEYHPSSARPVAQITDGTLRAVSGDAGPLRSGRRYLDAESGLEYDRFRYYDPAAGSFLPARVQRFHSYP